MLMVRELPQVNVPEVLLPFDEAGARLNIEKAAYLGFAKAQLKMGAAYELCSMGCEFDPALSLHYNSLAARQGEGEAEMAISKWFLCGYEGVFQKNDELAYVYAERAAQSGLATAEFAMGYFNEIGIHVKVNLEKAREWYAKAAEQGNQDALGRVEGLKKDNALSKDHEQAAINRIRSQYGSKRGGRPERFKDRPPVPPLPSVSDHGEGLPPRAASAAPYPMTDEPPRSASAAPYPLGDGPPHGRSSGPPGGFFNPNGQGPPPPGGRGQPSPGLAAFHFNTDGPPQRPATTTNDPRGRNPQGQQRYPSGPPGFPGGGFNNGPGPRANSLSPNHGPQQTQDIGFVAPLQPRRQTPTQSPGHSPVYGAQGQAPGPRPPRGQGAQPGVGGRNPRPGGGPDLPQKIPQGRPGPGPQQQGPGRPGAGRGGGPGPGQPGRKQTKQANPLGSGPKTFEEMGIAAQKQEGECVSFLCPTREVLSI
jgi:Sel1 repeat